jgi:hypothetical protein
MRDFLILFVHLIVTVVRLAGPGGLAPLLPNPRWFGTSC